MQSQSKISSSEPFSVVITGGLGCVGIAITTCLAERLPHATIHILDLSIPDRVDDRFSDTVAKYHKVDVTDLDSVLEAFQCIRPPIVIHTAGLLPSVATKIGLGDAGLFNVNVGGTKNVLKAALQVEAEALVYTSSCDVAKTDSWADLINVSEKDDPPADAKFDDKYSETKAHAERLVLDAATTSSMKTCALRAHAVIGRGDNNLVPLLANVPRGIIIGPGKNLFDFTGVDNFALAHVLAVENLLGTATANGKAFFTTDSDPKPFRQLFEMVCSELDRKAGKKIPDGIAYPYRVIPIWLVVLILRIINFPFKILGKDDVLPVDGVGNGTAQRYFDNSAAKELLGYNPEVSLDKSVQDACETYNKTISALQSAKNL
ncbi:NAD(P)-binding protein [Microthyrium microscopicum]|uniref:NAD(P)-binding protein n=1 Tax=Microthyrium microscopicum TaxID=703497 RepID=A0A6A6UN88_9PEZI|nr:NAD(P)-binding protein [Microthyrium microscopicum]